MDISSYPVITESKAVKKICQPFFETFGINYFNFTRFYHEDNSLVILDTDPNWTTHFFEQEYVVMATHVQSGPMFLDSSPINAAVVQDADENYNYTQCIAYVTNLPTYREIFYMGVAKSSKNMAEFYFSQQEAIQNFFFYFKQAAEKIIVLAETKRIPIPEHMIVDNVSSEIADLSNQNFDCPKHYYIEGLAGQVQLTSLEMHCSLRYILDEPIQAIASNLDLTPKAVERHIKNTQKKLGTDNVNLLKRCLSAYLSLCDQNKY